ncbi:MAG: hypothetical protein CXT73_04580 [Methanobacteriota archaeon]|nr:MAG: hypothetical protein CXT73_04580 [Euryarchaeota archaeon]
MNSQDNNEIQINRILPSETEDFRQILQLINNMNTTVERATLSPLLLTPERLFDPRRLVLGEMESDDDEVIIQGVNTSGDTDEFAEGSAIGRGRLVSIQNALEHREAGDVTGNAMPPYIGTEGEATMPTSNVEENELDTEEKISDENSDMSISEEEEEEEGKQDCCVCYKTKADLHTLVLPTCGHIICNSCFFRWLRTSPTCPMCRDDFTSWNRVSDDTIRNDIYNITTLFNKVSRVHNELMQKNTSIRSTNNKLKKKREKLHLVNINLKNENDGLISDIIRRREYTDYIRGFNIAIVVGNVNSNDVDIWTKNYNDGFDRGLQERAAILETLDITHDELLKVQPKQVAKIYNNIVASQIKYRGKIVIRKRKRTNVSPFEFVEVAPIENETHDDWLKSWGSLIP